MNAGRRSAGGRRNRDPPASDLLVLHALVFPLSFPFGRLPRRLDLLTIENTDSDLKKHALYYGNELLVRVSFPFKNFCKHAQHADAIRKHCLGKE